MTSATGIRLSATYLNHPLLCMGLPHRVPRPVLCTAFDTEPFRNLLRHGPRRRATTR